MIKRFIYVFIAAALFASCQEDIEYGQYAVEKTPPGAVKNVTYLALPGAVQLKYVLPPDKDLSYVKAIYQLDNKVVKEAKASAYTNELLLEGFGKGDSVRQIKVVAVDVNQNESEPCMVDVAPKASPIYETFATIDAGETYGGVQLRWKNPEKFNVILVVKRENAVGEMEQVNNGKIFAEGTGKEDTRTITGLDSIQSRFAIHIEDRWGNRTKEYDFIAKPIFEELIDRSSFRRWNPSNAEGYDRIPYQAWWGNNIETIWDGKHAGNFSTDNCYSTASGNNERRITFDLVSQIQPTRMKLWVRLNEKYSRICEYVRVWGSNDPQALPTFDQTAQPESHRWILLTEEQGPSGGYHIYKPSGLPGTQVTSADVQYCEIDGLDIFFKKNMPTVRYICIEMISMWNVQGSPSSFTIAEVAYWGKYIKK